MFNPRQTNQQQQKEQIVLNVETRKRGLTVERKELQAQQRIVLGDAFARWLNMIIINEEKPLREGEAFYEDLKDGVALCLLLPALGIPCKPPKMNPKNIFEQKANFQQFLQAVKQAGFRNNSPSFEDSYKSLMATLLECATVANIQNQVIARRSSSVGGEEKSDGSAEVNNIIAVPSEIMEEAAKVDMSKSEVLQKAMLGDIVSPQRVANSQEEVQQEEEEEEEESEEALLAKKNALLNGALKRAPEPAPKKPVEVDEKQPAVSFSPPPAVAAVKHAGGSTTASPTPMRRKIPAQVTNQPPKRNVKEIPQDEKDQMFNMCVLMLVLVLFLLWLMR